MMHGPLTLQNIYQAIPAATVQFAESEFFSKRLQNNFLRVQMSTFGMSIVLSI